MPRAAAQPSCSLADKGGLDVVAQVGACQRADCVHNSELECHAPAVTVGAGADNADCLTYRAAAS